MNVKNKKLFQVVKQVEKSRIFEEVGAPIEVPFCKYRDQKSRIKNLLKNSPVAYGSDEDDDETFDRLGSVDDTDTDLFNQALGSTPYAVDDRGVANYEAVLAKNDVELKQLRSYMSFKDDPAFLHLSALLNDAKSKDEVHQRLKYLADELKAGKPEPSDPANPSDGLPE